jgi:hypothetical protein
MPCRNSNPVPSFEWLSSTAGKEKVTVEKSGRANGQTGNQLPATPSGCPPSCSHSPLPPSQGPAEAAPCSCRQLVSAPMAISQLCVHGARCMFRTGLVPKSIRSSHHRDPVPASRAASLRRELSQRPTCVSCPIPSSVVQHRVGGAGPLHPRVVAIKSRLYPS